MCFSTQAAEDAGVRRVHDPQGVLNPLRSDDEAFRFLLYAIAIIGAIVAVILILRAILWGRTLHL